MKERAGEPVRGESRIPMAIAVLTVGGLYLLIPADFRIADWTEYAYPAILVGLLVALTVGDPGRIDRDQRWLRTLTGVLVGIVIAGAMFSAGRLVVGILQSADFTSPGQLLTIGAIVWITAVIGFALWYWHIDRGGPAARARGASPTAPSWHFPEDEIASVPEGWFPQFIDYFALSFNTATAFSATDVAAIRRWAKLAMMLEAAMSLTLVALVVARAVNIL